MKPPRLLIYNTGLISLIILFLVFLNVNCFGQQSKELVVKGRVIAVEQPEFGWAMEFESVKIFYLRIEKVLKGKIASKYIRIAYGYNPSSSPKYILPEKMFNGKTSWKFNLYEREEFDKKVADRKSKVDSTNSKIDKNITDSIFEALPEDIRSNSKLIVGQPIEPIYESILGYEKEAATLETLGVIKGYWLDFEPKGYKKL